MNDSMQAAGPDAERGPHPTPPLKDHDRPRRRKSEEHIDRTLEETFPASDAPATGGVTRIDPTPAPVPRKDDAGRAP